MSNKKVFSSQVVVHVNKRFEDIISLLCRSSSLALAVTSGSSVSNVSAHIFCIPVPFYDCTVYCESAGEVE